MNKTITIWAAALIMTSIALGAMGAHGLKEVLDDVQINSFLTGVRYQMYIGLSLLVLGLSYDKIQFNLKWITGLLIIGVIFFSVSIYLLSLQDVIGTKLSFFGVVTPLGGILMIAGWFLFIYKLAVKKS